MRFAIVFVFALSLLGQQSQPPSPTPAKTGQEKQQDSTSKEGKSNDHKTVSQPVTGTVGNIPVVQETRKQHNDPPSTDWWIVFFTAVIAGASLWQGYIYWHQKGLMSDALAETRKAADAATKSAEAAERTAEATAAQFELTERPWLVVDAGPLSDLTFNESGITVKVGFTVTNTGRSPGSSVHLDSFIHLTGDNCTHSHVERDRLCETVSQRDSYPAVIFPHGQTTVVLTLNANKNRINESIAPGSNFISMDLVTCVAYRSTFGKSVYYTGTIHHFGRVGEDGRSGMTFKVGESLSMIKVRLDINPRWGTIAG